jgi:hypothetical protein
MRFTTDTNALLTFSFGNSDIPLYIDNITVNDITSTYTFPAAGTNMVTNGDFSQGLSGWEYWLDGTEALPAVETGELHYSITTA